MSESFKKIKTPLIVIVVLIVAFFAYTTFFKGSASSSSNQVLQSTGTGDAGNTSDVGQVEQGFLGLLLQVQNVKIDQSVFSNPAFLSLQDDSPPLVDQPIGRVNPFAPIGTDSGSNSATGANVAATTTGQGQ